MFAMHMHAIPNEDEDAEDFKPARKLQWKERSTDVRINTDASTECKMFKKF